MDSRAFEWGPARWKAGARAQTCAEVTASLRAPGVRTSGSMEAHGPRVWHHSSAECWQSTSAASRMHNLSDMESIPAYAEVSAGSSHRLDGRADLAVARGHGAWHRTSLEPPLDPWRARGQRLHVLLSLSVPPAHSTFGAFTTREYPRGPTRGPQNPRQQCRGAPGSDPGPPGNSWRSPGLERALPLPSTRE